MKEKLVLVRYLQSLEEDRHRMNWLDQNSDLGKDWMAKKTKSVRQAIDSAMSKGNGSEQ